MEGHKAYLLDQNILYQHLYSSWHDQLHHRSEFLIILMMDYQNQKESLTKCCRNIFSKFQLTLTVTRKSTNLQRISKTSQNFDFSFVPTRN